MIELLYRRGERPRAEQRPRNSSKISSGIPLAFPCTARSRSHPATTTVAAPRLQCTEKLLSNVAAAGHGGELEGAARWRAWPTKTQESEAGGCSGRWRVTVADADERVLSRWQASYLFVLGTRSRRCRKRQNRAETSFRSNL